MAQGRTTTAKGGRRPPFFMAMTGCVDMLPSGCAALRPWLGAWLGLVCAAAVQANGVYRCGDTYTNQKPWGEGCQRLQGGHVSVMGQAPEAPRDGGEAPASASQRAAPKATPASGAERQQAALAVLRAELHRAQARLAQAQAELARATTQGAADATPEAVAVTRAQDDVDSLRREIKRWEGQSR